MKTKGIPTYKRKKKKALVQSHARISLNSREISA